MKKLVMLSGNIAVEEIEPKENVTEGGIHIPGTVLKGPLLMGTVIARSESYFAFGARVPTDISVGDHVVYEAQRGKSIDLDGKKITVLHVSDIKLRVAEEEKKKA
jgi:co-chaperonin GroES (HSP10)